MTSRIDIGNDWTNRDAMNIDEADEIQTDFPVLELPLSR